jgi:deoxyribodipyrimidine photo-lyase
MSALVWFRRDLRVHDHPALHAASSVEDGAVVPVFCFDPALLGGRHRSGPRTQFLLECLSELGESFRARGSRLVIRIGPPEREIPALAAECGVSTVHVTADASPFATRRDRRVARALAAGGAELVTHPGAFVVDDLTAITTGAGAPYSVFTPFYRRWRAEPRRTPRVARSELAPIPSKVRVGRLPSLEELGLEQELSDPMPGGEQAAAARARALLAGPVRHYASDHDTPSLARGTSRLSPYLHFGCISPRALEQRLLAGAGGEAFARQLCWRDFYAHVLLARPANLHSEYTERYRRGALRWSRSRPAFDAWRRGQTGYPFVDAGMRELLREGWMHNRVRMVVGSFLTKHLGIDWRWGERWFMRMLLDGDEANNNGNWQWIASVGVDPQPPYRRIYNPARQQQRFDPDGSYVRANVPELRDVPDRYLAQPWTMAPELQREIGCVIGTDYPAPIVDHARARREALDRYAAVVR